MPHAEFDGIESLENRLSLSTVLWTGAGDGVTLNSRYNWQCNHLPTSCDTAIVDRPGTLQIRMTTGSFNPYKFIFAEELAFTGGTINVGSGGTTLSGSMAMSGGVFGGSGAIRDSGLLHWTGGQIAGSGSIDIATSGVLDLDGASPLLLGRNISNHGRINWLGGNIDLARSSSSSCPGGSGGTGPVLIVNQGDALFKATGTGRLRVTAGTARLDNLGLFVRDTDGVSQILIPFTNSGTLNTAGGTLQLFRGGSNSGPRNVAAGATLHYFGDFVEAAGSTLAGGGSTVWQGGVHTISGAWSMASYLYISNATVTGAADWTIDGVLGWSHGTLSGTGNTIIGPTGKIEIRTFGQHTLARDILNNGTLLWNRGPLTMAGATITNPAGMNFYVAADAIAVDGGGGNRIVNHGQIRKVLPTSAGFGAITLDSDGLVNVRNGSLTLDQGSIAQLSGGTLSAGSWMVFGHATLSFSGAQVQTVGASALVERYGAFASFDALSSLTRNEGIVRVYGGDFLDLSPVGGVFTNAGTLVLGNMTALRIGGDFVQEASGMLDIGLGGPLTLTSGRVLIAQNATLDGMVSVSFELGYSPSVGDEFLFLGATSAQGTFSGAVVESDLTTEFVYLPDGVLLRFV